jgi:uncharacterized protein (DUF58 family)
VEFLDPEGAGSITVGRAESWRGDFVRRVAEHRETIRTETDRRSWSFAVHRTDRPASELLLALRARMGETRDMIARRRPADLALPATGAAA